MAYTTHLRVLWSLLFNPSLPGCSLLLRHLQQAILAICCFPCVLDVLGSPSVLPAPVSCSSLLWGLQSWRTWKQESVCWCYSSLPSSRWDRSYPLALQRCQLPLCPPVLPWAPVEWVQGVLGWGCQPRRSASLSTRSQALKETDSGQSPWATQILLHLTWPFIVLWNDWKCLNGIQ